MIRKLQNKFIVISMLSMLLVLTVIIGSINIINYRQLIEDADHILHILSENDGEFPKDRPRPDSREPQGGNSSPDFKDGLVDNASPDPREPQGNNSSTPKKPKLHSMDMSPEMPFETRYFSVVLTENGNVSSTNVQKVAAIDNEDANAYALRAWKRQQTSGFLLPLSHEAHARGDKDYLCGLHKKPLHIPRFPLYQHPRIHPWAFIRVCFSALLFPAGYETGSRKL